MAEVHHALGLTMHQPLGNLLELHNSGESWEASQILWCYDRPTRMLEGYEDATASAIPATPGTLAISAPTSPITLRSVSPRRASSTRCSGLR